MKKAAFKRHRNQHGITAFSVMGLLVTVVITLLFALFLANVGASTYNKAHLHFVTTQVANFASDLSQTEATDPSTTSTVKSLLTDNNLYQYVTGPSDIKINTTQKTVTINLHNLSLIGNGQLLQQTLSFFTDTANFPASAPAAQTAQASYAGSIAIPISSGTYAYVPIAVIGNSNEGPSVSSSTGFAFQSFNPPSQVGNLPLFYLSSMTDAFFGASNPIGITTPAESRFNGASPIRTTATGSEYALFPPFALDTNGNLLKWQSMPNMSQVDFYMFDVWPRLGQLSGAPVYTGLYKI